jgi:hypothetical protein
MKKTQIALLSALTLALAGTLVLRAAEEGRQEGQATIRSVHGQVEWLDGQVWQLVRPNMKFKAGVTLRTGANGTADLSVNGMSSAVRITNNTILRIPTMNYIGSAREGDTDTMLDLVTGSVLGNVKKITANSRYEITTPHGVAGIRGTDFSVLAIPTEDHKWIVTFNSITGTITVSAVIDGRTVIHTLTTGTSWTIGEEPKRMTEDIIMNFQSQILSLINTIENLINNGPPPGRPPGSGPGTSPGNPTQPFPGGPPRGPPSS